jgi:tRNA A-37 threonylcarbamoyl transferase component Bud32
MHYSGLAMGFYLVLVTDYIDGECAQTVDALSYEQKLSCVSTLDQIHRLGVLHGDVRIPNFVFAKTPEPKSFLIDFGRSLILDKSQTKQQDLLNQEMDDFKNLLFST